VMLLKSICKSCCLIAAAGVSVSFIGVRADAQTTTTPRAGARHRAAAQTTSPLAMAHKTFEEAAKVMESALPIYDGHRHRAIELAKMTAKEIKEAATGAPATLNPATGQHHTASERAALVAKGKNESLSKYSPSQIAASNAQMQRGMQLLQQGMQQLQSLGKDSNGHMNDAAEFSNMSMQAVNTGLQFVASKTGAGR
jgi:hypothetical protein